MNESLREKVLAIVEWYGAEVDPHGWEIDARLEAVDRILEALILEEAKT